MNAGTVDLSTPLLYVGTPTGLVGLITDIKAIGIADGAVLLPFATPTVMRLLFEQVLPQFETVGTIVPSMNESTPA